MPPGPIRSCCQLKWTREFCDPGIIRKPLRERRKDSVVTSLWCTRSGPGDEEVAPSHLCDRANVGHNLRLDMVPCTMPTCRACATLKP